jgi:hypothetical protein
MDNEYYLTIDNTFLIDKCYSQFLNDFWFDWLKLKVNKEGKNIYNIREYRSVFGAFFESYVDEIIKKCFANYKYSKLL